MTRYVRTSDTTPNVYHTDEDCRRLPENYREVKPGENRRSMHECHECKNYDVPTLE